MIIRSAIQADIAMLLDLERKAIDAGYPSPFREKLLEDPEIGARDIWGRWQRRDIFLIAQRQETILGYAIVTCPPSETELSALFVDPDHWRMGVGTKLIDAAVRTGARFGASRLLVTANPTFIAFYEANGFKQLKVEDKQGLMVPTLARELG